jgi:hypothetical protein
MDQKDKITHAIAKLKEDPARWKNLTDFAKSKLTEEQKKSSVYESLLNLKIREILSEYT